ncbi:MAG TPA: peptidoglycan-binding protein, partial [Gemmatirosa sp.]
PDPAAAFAPARDPAALAAVSYDTPVTVADPTAPSLVAQSDAEEDEDTFGDRVVAAADTVAADPDARARRSSAVLAAVLDAVGAAGPLSPLGPSGTTGGHAPSATELYNAFVHGDDPRRPRHRFRDHYARRFVPVAMPGDRVGDADLRAGDIVVRVARGEGWGHVAVATCPRLFAATELRGGPAGGYRPGRYALVIECAPVPRARRDRFPRRLTDAAGGTLPGTLVLRIRRASTTGDGDEAVDGRDAWRESIDHTADLSDAFFAAMHAVSASLGTRPEFLLGVMNSESGIRASAHNPNGHASGLIQFMPATLRALGWTQGHEAFRQLAADEQMPYVQRYFLPHVPRGLDSTARLYQATFLPATLSRGSAPDTVLVDVNAGDNAFAYGPNRGLDRRGDGRILVGDLTAFVDRAKRSARWREALDRLQLSAPGIAPPAPAPAPAPAPVPPPDLPPAPAAPAGTHPVLRVGARGNAVREAQLKLNLVHTRATVLGGPGLSGAPLAIDGEFGPQTRAAVVSFQGQAFPSSPGDWDGVVGPRTWAQLDRASLGAAATEADVGETTPSTPHPTLRRGARGAAVVEAQQKLNAVHADEVAHGRGGLRDAPLAEDGQYGRHTFNAVVSFQQRAFPAAPPEWDGVLGPKTWAALDAAALGSGPAAAVTITDVAEYVALDVVLETLTGTAPSVFTRQGAFRDRATLDAHIGGTDLLVGGPVRIDPADATKFVTRVRFQLAFPPSAANPTVPAGTGQLPLAVLVHGNHAAYFLAGGVLAEHESYKGYRYLQEELARQGIASISVDTNLANQLGSFIELRADLALAALARLRRRVTTSGDALFGRIDFDRVGLMGHSRGGDAVVRVVKKNAALSGAARVGIQTVCSLSPTDVTGGQVPADRVFVADRELGFYSVVYGALDGDVSGLGGSNDSFGTGFRHYDRARCPKALVFAERCCHNSFNSVWHHDGLDAGLDPADATSGRLADEATHQAIATEYIGGQFAWQLRGATTRAQLFSGVTPSATGMTTAHLWAFGDQFRHVDDFEQPAALLAGVSRRLDAGAAVEDFGSIVVGGVSLNDHVLEQGHVVHANVAAATRSPFGVSLQLGAGQRDLSAFTTLALDVGSLFDVTSPASIATGAPPAFQVTVRDTSGAAAVVGVAAFSPAPGRPFFHRLVTGENVTALHLETVRAPLSAFTGVDLRNVAAIVFDASLSPNAHVFVDDVKLAVL